MRASELAGRANNRDLRFINTGVRDAKKSRICAEAQRRSNKKIKFRRRTRRTPQSESATTPQRLCTRAVLLGAPVSDGSENCRVL